MLTSFWHVSSAAASDVGVVGVGGVLHYPPAQIICRIPLLLNELRNIIHHTLSVLGLVFLTIPLLMARHVVVVVVKSSSNGPK